MRWQPWAKADVPPRAMVTWYLEAAKLDELDLSLALMDSATVRAHQRSAGGAQKGDQALGRSCDSLGTKVHMIAVSESQVPGVIPSGGQAEDAPAGGKCSCRDSPTKRSRRWSAVAL